MARSLVERELKLRVKSGFALPELPGEALAPRTIDSTYVDTEDRRLGRAGITLRRRVENGRSVWQLKLPRKGARLEVEADGGPLPPDELTEPLVAVLRGRELVPVAVLRTHRQPFAVSEDGRELAEVVLDDVSVLEGQRVERGFREVEVELREAANGELDGIVATLRRAGARKASARTKLEQVLGAPAAPARTTLAAALDAQLRALNAHDPGVRLGGDPEDVHQLRVATRRARAYLRLAAPLLDPAWSEPLREELRWLGQTFGAARDLDVLGDHLQQQIAQLDPVDTKAAAPLLKRLRAERKTLQTALLKTLSSDRYLALLDALEAGPPQHDGPSLEALAAKELKQLAKAVAALPAEPADEQLHEIRIKAKRVRYAAELTGDSKVVEAAKALQDVLGEHQDAFVADQRLRELVRPGDAPATAFAAGRLLERERVRRDAGRREFPPAWRKLRRRAEAAWS